MPRLRIVSINMTHSQEDKIPRCSTDREWAQAIGLCLLHNEPLYVAPRGHDDYLRQYFINQTLNADGYIIPGDYETEIPEHGKVGYSIWTEKSDYYKSYLRPIKLKPSFWERNEDCIKMTCWSMLTVTVCIIINDILERFGIDYDVFAIVVGYLFGSLAVKNERIKELKERL